jgi:hypothetical protein
MKDLGVRYISVAEGTEYCVLRSGVHGQ